MNILLFILICFGITKILTQGAIFNSIRPKHKFFHCPLCVSTWLGFLVFLGFWFSGIKLFPNIYLGTFFFGCISSGTSYILCYIIDDNGLNINLK
jgi:hypothetical protein